MVIYLKHPVHGTKVAIAESEAEADAQNGWIEYNPDTPAKKEAEAAPVNTLDVKRRRKE
jgi:hypothetical protein